jgi:hypothetical protein
MKKETNISTKKVPHSGLTIAVNSIQLPIHLLANRNCGQMKIKTCKILLRGCNAGMPQGLLLLMPGERRFGPKLSQKSARPVKGPLKTSVTEHESNFTFQMNLQDLLVVQNLGLPTTQSSVFLHYRLSRYRLFPY